MYQILTYVEDNFAKSAICSTELKNGEVVLVKGLADSTLAKIDDIGVEGECYEVGDLEDDANKILAMVASDGHRYEKETSYNFGDYANTPSGEAVRIYFLHKGMVVSIEKSLIDGTVAKGDQLTVKAGSHNLKKYTAPVASEAGTGEADAKRIVGEVIGTSNLMGKDMVQILFY